MQSLIIEKIRSRRPRTGLWGARGKGRLVVLNWAPGWANSMYRTCNGLHETMVAWSREPWKIPSKIPWQLQLASSRSSVVDTGKDICEGKWLGILYLGNNRRRQGQRSPALLARNPRQIQSDAFVCTIAFHSQITCQPARMKPFMAHACSVAADAWSLIRHDPPFNSSQYIYMLTPSSTRPSR